MADYRLSVSMIGRGAGKSVMAAAAYRAGQCLTDDRTGRVHDYTRKGGVEWAAVAAPKDSPDWARNREGLWNRVEAAENRVNSQTAREFQLSLPQELDFKQRRDLVVEFVAREFTMKGLPVDIAMHKPGKEGDQRNYHAHILVPTRAIAADGFGPKLREMNSTAQLTAWRKSWADIQNRHLEKALGKDAPKVSHLSLEERAIGRPPQIHLGPHVSAMERRGICTDRGSQNRANQHRLEIDRLIRRIGPRIDGLKYGVEDRAVDRIALDLTKLAIGMTKENNERITELKAVIAEKKAVKPWSKQRVEAAVLQPEKQAMDKAKVEFEARKKDAGVTVSHKKIMAWLHDPAKQLFHKIAKDFQLDLAAGRYAETKRAHDKIAHSLKTPWGTQRVEQLVVKSRQPLNALRTKERRLRRQAKHTQAWARRAAKTADHLHLLRDAGAIITIEMPKKTDLDTMFIRNAELGLARSYKALTPSVTQNLGKSIMRNLGIGLGIGR